jgi:hypothetical protein
MSEVKVIVADRKYDASHRLGQFLDESDYDTVIDFDCDVYAPPDCDLGTQAECTSDCSSCEKGMDERKIVFKLRKNYFSKEEQDAAYIGLREAAVETQNRGIAAGPRAGKLGNREWVTAEEFDIIDYFLKPTENIFGDDPIDVIRKEHEGKKEVVDNRSQVWGIAAVKADNFNFDEWVESTRKLDEDGMKAEANRVVNRYVCKTTYANGVMSGIAGWYDRYPRIPYGRATSYTDQHPEKFEMAYPFLQTLAKGFESLLPWRYGNQMEAAKKLDPKFLVPGTPFTTITVNKTFRTAAHYDAGDLTTGLSNLLVLSNNGNYSGGMLVAPEYRVAVNVRPGDLLLINNHEVMHGNTPIEMHDDEAERVSLVCYFREKMLELGSWDYEQTRKEYVDSRRLNQEHPEWRKLWNGVSPGMWDDQEWYDYLETKLGRGVLAEYHPKAVEKVAALDEFFG